MSTLAVSENSRGAVKQSTSQNSYCKKNENANWTDSLRFLLFLFISDHYADLTSFLT